MQKLPHLDQKQKGDYGGVVRGLWELINSRDSQSPEYQNALIRLNQISQTLMKGMRAYQQNRQQQAQAAAQNQQGQRPQALNPQNFSQLLPQIQQKISNVQFLPPPNFAPEQVQQWLAEAKLRYGIALQKYEVGRARITEVRQQVAQRQTAGTMSREEMQEFKNRQLAAEKVLREGSDFLSKFRDQQETIKSQRAQHLGQTPAVKEAAPFQLQAQPNGQIQARGQGQAQPQSAHPSQTQVNATGPGAENRPANASAQSHPGQPPAPAPHTINSAVTAARNQAGQASASPVTSQPNQTPTTQIPSAISAPPQQQQAPQGSFAQTQNQAISTPTSATPTTGAPQPSQQQEQPRPLSHQAAMQQAAQSYANNVNQQQQNMPQAPAVNPHAHPQGYIPNRNSENSTRNTHMPIPKSLNVSTPEPIPMAPARPSLSGGPSHGAMGMMGQPAIQKHPGYVLEGEGQRVLSKKMLDTLVRQVTGGGEGEGLTPDAEEVRAQHSQPVVHLSISFFLRTTRMTLLENPLDNTYSYHVCHQRPHN